MHFKKVSLLEEEGLNSTGPDSFFKTKDRNAIEAGGLISAKLKPKFIYQIYNLIFTMEKVD